VSDSYQAIYDAVRSRIYGGDIGQAAEAAMRSEFGNAGHLMQCVAQDFQVAADEQRRPSAIFRPAISLDGNQWCALYGANLQEGVAGFGNSPSAAMHAFDKAWLTNIVSTEGTAG
jgi:hypothetical protein